jgi:RimJ/RimL family protein N-acetyltransferase
MNIKLIKIDIDNDIQLHHYVKWENDLDLYHLIAPMRSKNVKVEHITVESTREYFENQPERLKRTFIIFDNEKPIGQITMHIDPEHLYKNEEGTCWFGLTIGEKEYWGSGAAAIAMAKFESLVREMSLKRIELGVFEFNVRAQKFYEKLGYRKIGEIEDFTFWNNQFWKDIRMEKYL